MNIDYRLVIKMLTLLILTIRMACHGMFVTFKIPFLIREASTPTTIGILLFANVHVYNDDGAYILEGAQNA